MLAHLVQYSMYSSTCRTVSTVQYLLYGAHCTVRYRTHVRYTPYCTYCTICTVYTAPSPILKKNEHILKFGLGRPGNIFLTKMFLNLDWAILAMYS